MGKLEIMSSMSRSFHKIGFQLKKHSPEILAVAGTIGVIASGVLACKATLKVNEVLEPAKESIDKIHEATEKGVTEAGEVYSIEDSHKDLTTVYTQTGIKFVKLYGPSVALGVLSITSLLTSNNILRKRNIALAAAYTAVDTSFKNYRSRVVERFGKEIDRELKYNIKKAEIEETVIDENGNEATVKKTVDTVNRDMYSDYAKFFDDGNLGWEPDPEYNLMYLKTVQNHANDLLRCRGYLFLNDVYDMLGIPRTKAGNIVGWLYDTQYGGDGFVDFGIYDIYKEGARDFVNGYEKSILLDFNVDGEILDRVELKRI